MSSRNNMLLAPDKKNFKEVEQLYESTKKQELERAKRGNKKSHSQVERELDKMRLQKGSYYDNRTSRNPKAEMDAKMGSTAGELQINYGGSAASGAALTAGVERCSLGIRRPHRL